ncbi:MAG TPA: BatA and WFA domain-containing protein [Methanothrix sp.]|nr:BatA and WFA domain-containing protein [Methanothrix sp.]
MPFSNSMALLGLFSIIPLIIIYLIRPRPKEVRFSATQFLREGEAERSAVLSRLINDPLFWVQLLVLCTLSVAAAGPFTVEEGPASSHLVVVLDGSASMQASFSRALQMIEPYLDKYQRISIVLAESMPLTVLQEGTPAEARDALRLQKAKAVSSDLSSGMTLASSLLAGEGGHMLVVSDFISWTGDDPQATRKILQADGRVSIVFADSYQGGDNLALVEAWDVPGPGYVNHTALVHNFGPARVVPLTIRGPGGSTSRTVQMAGGADYYLSFTAHPGVNEISLDLEDAVAWDNHAYVYVPNLAKKRVLYRGEEGPALAALQSLPNVQAETSGQLSNFDLIVVARNASLDGELNRYIDGGRVIFIASDKESPEYLPVRVTGEQAGPASLWVRSEGFAKGLHFDEIGIFRFPQAASRKGSTTLVEANGVPILSYWRLGKGMVIYSGLEMDSDFYLRPEYPIFWYQMVSWITDVPDITQSNRKTGEVLHLGETAIVETPSTSIFASNLLLDEVGVYRFQGKAVAANMYDSRESSLQRKNGVDAGQFVGGSRETIVEKDLSNWVIALAALAILLELVVMRRRRET